MDFRLLYFGPCFETGPSGSGIGPMTRLRNFSLSRSSSLHCIVPRQFLPDRVRDNRPDSTNVTAGLSQQRHSLVHRGHLARPKVKEAAIARSHSPLQARARPVGTAGKNSGQSFKCSLIVNYNSRFKIIRKWPVKQFQS